MTQESKSKLDILVAATILFSFVALAAFFAAFSKSEGTIGEGAIANFIADYALYIYPLYFIASSITFFHSASLLLVFGLNIVLYALLATTLSKILKKLFKKYKPFLATYYVTLFILFIAFAWLINLFVSAQ
jgi:hypothetical protein